MEGEYKMETKELLDNWAIIGEEGGVIALIKKSGEGAIIIEKTNKGETIFSGYIIEKAKFRNLVNKKINLLDKGELERK